MINSPEHLQRLHSCTATHHSSACAALWWTLAAIHLLMVLDHLLLIYVLVGELLLPTIQHSKRIGEPGLVPA